MAEWQTYSPEKPSSTNIPNILMPIKPLLQQLSQILSLHPHILQQIIIPNNPLHRNSRCTRNRMPLIRLAMQEAPRALCERINDPTSSK
jgi:hypothetical protein